MPTAEEILNGLIGINGFVVDTEHVFFDTTSKTVRLMIKPAVSDKAICDGCGCACESIKDRRERGFRDLAAFSWMVQIIVLKRRVICPRCGIRSERLPFADGRSNFCKRFEITVFADCRSEPVAQIARRHEISWDQAALIERKYLEAWNRWRGPLRAVEWLGVDEICFGNYSRMYTIVSDLKNGSVIGLIDGHQTASLDAFFTQAGESFCNGVKVVCMDMWKAYRQSVSAYCRNAKIIYDKFHIIRHLNNALDEVRRAEFFRKSKEQRELMCGKRWLLLRRWFNLTTPQKGLLKEVFTINTRLSKAHYLKEIFGELWGYRSRPWALKFLQRWEQELRWQRLKPFKKFLEMVKKHLEGILNYCDTKIPLGLVESINGKIKSIIRQTRGFLDIKHGALKIMFMTDSKALEFLKVIHT